MSNPTPRAYYIWEKSSLADDFLQLKNPDGTVAGGIGPTGAGYGALAGGGAVPSVFGRTGAIVAQSGDYSSAQITNPTPTWINVKNIAYGAKGDAQKVTDGSGGVGFVTSATANFQPSDVGKRIWSITSDSSGTIVVDSTITAYVSATRVNVAAGGAGYTSTIVVWGTDDTAALIAACTAAVPAKVPIGLQHPSVIYCPAGGYIFSKLPFDFVKQGYVFIQPGIEGDGQDCTVFFPSPSYDFTSTYPNGGMLISSAYNAGGGWIGAFTLDGTNVTRSGGASYYYGAFITGHEIRNLTATGFNTGVGYAIRSTTSLVHNCVAVTNSVGGWLFQGSGPCTVIGGLFSNSAPSAEVLNFDSVSTGSTITFHGSEFDEPGLLVVNSQNVALFGCTVYGGDPNGCLNVDATSSVYIFGGTIGAFGTPTNATGLKIQSGGLCACFGVYIYGRGSGFAVNNEGIFIDGGGNHIVNNTSAGNVFTGDGTFSQRFSVPTASSANAGSNGDVPAQVLGYKIESLNDGTAIKIPYYAV